MTDPALAALTEALHDYRIQNHLTHGRFSDEDCGSQSAAILAHLTANGWHLREGECIEATLEVTQDEADLARKAAAWDAVREHIHTTSDCFCTGWHSDVEASYMTGCAVERIAAALEQDDAGVSPGESQV